MKNIVFKKGFSTMFFVLISFLLNQNKVLALEIDNGFEKYSVPTEYKEILLEYDFIKYLKNPINNGAILDLVDSLELLFRNFGWVLLKLLTSLVLEIENILFSVFTKLNVMNLIFSNDTTLLKGIIIITLFFGIIISAYKISVAHFNGTEQQNTFGKFAKGLVGSIMLILTIGFIMTSLENFTVSYAKNLKSDGTTSIIEGVLSSTVVDVEESIKNKKIINPKVENIYNINEFIYDREHDVLKYQFLAFSDLVYSKELESSETRNWWDNAVPFQPDEYHLKYSFNFLKAFVLLIGFSAVLGLNLLKFIYNSLSQFINLLFLLSTNSLDLIMLEKRKVVIDKIIGTFFANIYIVSSGYLLFLLIDIVNVTSPIITRDMNALSLIITELVMYIAVFWLMLDGADIIQQLTGQDGGLTKTGAIISAFGGKKVMDSVSKGTKQLGKGIVQKGINHNKSNQSNDKKSKEFSNKMKGIENAKGNQSQETDNGYENAKGNQSQETDNGYENAKNNQSQETDNGYENAKSNQSQENDNGYENAKNKQSQETDNGYENARSNKKQNHTMEKKPSGNAQKIWDFQHADDFKNTGKSNTINGRSRYERNRVLNNRLNDNLDTKKGVTDETNKETRN